VIVEEGGIAELEGALALATVNKEKNEPTLADIQERFIYDDMAGIDGKDVTWLLNRIAKLEAGIEEIRALPVHSEIDISCHEEHWDGLFVKLSDIKAALAKLPEVER
jgi:hypothetical protein